MNLIKELTKISEDAKVVSIKLSAPSWAKDEAKLDKWIEQQEIVTIEHVKLVGSTLEVYPHFELRTPKHNVVELQKKLQADISGFDPDGDLEESLNEEKDDDDEDYDDMSLSELIQKYLDQEKMYSMEGPRGVRNLHKLIQVLDNHYHNFDTFLQDNSGAIEAIIEWIGSTKLTDWKENIIDVLHPQNRG